MLNKLFESKGTLILLGIILIPYLIYHVVPEKTQARIIPRPVSTKTLEEIISAPVDKLEPLEWDKDFKSAIIPTNGAGK